MKTILSVLAAAIILITIPVFANEVGNLSIKDIYGKRIGIVVPPAGNRAFIWSSSGINLPMNAMTQYYIPPGNDSGEFCYEDYTIYLTSSIKGQRLRKALGKYSVEQVIADQTALTFKEKFPFTHWIVVPVSKMPFKTAPKAVGDNRKQEKEFDVQPLLSEGEYDYLICVEVKEYGIRHNAPYAKLDVKVYEKTTAQKINQFRIDRWPSYCSNNKWPNVGNPNLPDGAPAPDIMRLKDRVWLAHKAKGYKEDFPEAVAAYSKTILEYVIETQDGGMEILPVSMAPVNENPIAPVVVQSDKKIWFDKFDFTDTAVSTNVAGIYLTGTSSPDPLKITSYKLPVPVNEYFKSHFLKIAGDSGLKKAGSAQSADFTLSCEIKLFNAKQYFSTEEVIVASNVKFVVIVKNSNGAVIFTKEYQHFATRKCDIDDFTKVAPELLDDAMDNAIREMMADEGFQAALKNTN